jgi:hypothetical protein
MSLPLPSTREFMHYTYAYVDLSDGFQYRQLSLKRIKDLQFILIGRASFAIAPSLL